jgi:hypothetical protein
MKVICTRRGEGCYNDHIDVDDRARVISCLDDLTVFSLCSDAFKNAFGFLPKAGESIVAELSLARIDPLPPAEEEYLRHLENRIDVWHGNSAIVQGVSVEDLAGG